MAGPTLDEERCPMDLAAYIPEAIPVATTVGLFWRLWVERATRARADAAEARLAEERGALRELRARVVEMDQRQADVNRQLYEDRGEVPDDAACMSGALVRLLQEIDEQRQ